MIISFSQLGNHGRLANQLFQVASTKGIAEKTSAEAVFPEWPYEKYFENDVPHGTMQPNQVKEKQFHHYDWEIKESCDLHGYMQSEKYFTEPLIFKSDFIKEQKAKFNIWDKETICIHIRRGDYVGNINYYQLPITYYIDTLLNYFDDYKKYNILFISDDIEYCRVHFECLDNASFSVGGSDIEDMALGSCCDHFIIGNSTYAWWTAWIGEKTHSKIVHPGHYFTGPLSSNDTKDFWPRRWKSNQKDRYNIPLKDITFTIPVFYDHTNRKANLDLTVCMLQHYFETNIIVCEFGGTIFKYMSQWTKYFQIGGTRFHRTKMLNKMALLANTKIIVNYDCDILIPPMQFIVASDELQKCDVVFPYDGRFARMQRNPWFKILQKSLDIGIVGNSNFKGREHGHNSVGGCVMFNKNSFIHGGMENEHMVSFGPEDCERNDRFKKLGYDVRQIKGCLFHIDHWVGLNSSPRNPDFHGNHDELNKIRGMSKEELRLYVNSWPWCNIGYEVTT